MAASITDVGEAAGSRVVARGKLIELTLAREALPILVCCLLAGLVVALLAHLFSTDAWLALTAGRLIASNGLPHHDTLTLVAHGRPWVDQQWLGQLMLYGLHTVGGIRLVLGVDAALVVSAFAAAVFVARRRGGEPLTVAAVALVAVLPFLVTASAVRTQSFAYLPFVVLIALLTSTSKLGTTRVLLVFGGLVVWSNVHGSVLLAALLVSIRGAFGLQQGRREGRLDRIALALLLVPFICLFVSPYGLHLASYYRVTAFSSTFSKYLDYWAPTKFGPLSLPLYALLLGMVWVLGRARSAYTGYEAALMWLGVLLGLLALRNWTFASLLAIILLPAGLDRLRDGRGALTPGPLVAWFAGTAVVCTVGGAALALARPASVFTREFPARAAQVVQNAVAVDADKRVYASIKFGDWLMWKEPTLRGKVEFDSRYELLRGNELERLTLFRFGSGVPSALRRHEIFVLDPVTDSRAIASLRRRVRVLYVSDRVFVADVRA